MDVGMDDLDVFVDPDEIAGVPLAAVGVVLAARGMAHSLRERDSDDGIVNAEQAQLPTDVHHRDGAAVR